LSLFLFLELKLSKDTITSLAQEFLKDSDNYLIDISVSASGKISVLIENDKHVAIGDCIKLSRFIEHQLDREQEDFELEVSSPGIDQPFKSYKQFIKYIGHEIEVLSLNGEKQEGVLKNADQTTFTFLPNAGKSKRKQDKTTAVEEVKLTYQSVKHVKLVIKFK